MNSRPDPPAGGETIVDRLESHARARPGAAALGSPGRTVSFRELHALVGGAAGWLRALGVEPGERVGVSIADDLGHLVVAFALASLGAAHVSLPTHDPAAVRARMAQRVGARRVVAADPAHALDGLAFAQLDADRLDAWSHAAPVTLGRPDPTALFTYFTTSGTTGEAKIIPILHGRWLQQAPRGPAGSGLALSPVEHHFVKRLFLYAIQGGHTAVQRGRGDVPIAALCEHYAVEHAMCMTGQVGQVVADAATGGRLPSFTRLLVSGGRVPASMRRQLLESTCDAVAITYSMQECGSIARVVERDPAAVTETVGVPHEGVALELVDADGRPVPRGEPGEVRVRVPGMASGYLDDEHATAAKFRDGWFQPGDLASFAPDGALVVHGRADDVMNMNGVKIAPAEIERVLERHPAVKAVAVFPLASAVHGQIPVAAVELRDGASADERALQQFAREALGLRAPRRVAIVDALPATPQGKVDLRALARTLARRTDA